MPFLKKPRTRQPLWKTWDQKAEKSGLRHAIYSSDSGDRYVGEWKKSKQDGKGLQNFKCGDLYEGDWKNGLRNGYGAYSIRKPEGGYRRDYVGEWRNGKKYGKGIQYYANGEYYEGSWHRGGRSGHGRMWFEDGSFYEGQWKNDKQHGNGMFVQKNGNRYEGEWRDGLKDGYGSFYHLDSGQVQEGVWVKGLARCSTFRDIEYRQAALEPTQYPIPPCKLRDLDKVYNEAETSFLPPDQE